LRRILLICLSLVLALGGWSAVCADDGFYVIPAMRGNYTPVPKTGQTETYDKGDDGALYKGVAWPTPRFTDNANGTVTDKLTGLIWLKNANAFDQRTWADALIDAAKLADGNHDLKDGSKEGDWRLPNVRELQSLVNYGGFSPALPADNPFEKVEWNLYWSSTSWAAEGKALAWCVNFGDGNLNKSHKEESKLFVWCVRGGP
jgi:hypothetical protein